MHLSVTGCVHDACLTNKEDRQTEGVEFGWTLSFFISVYRGTRWEQFKKDVYLPLQYFSRTTFYLLPPVDLNGMDHWKVNRGSVLSGMCHLCRWLTIFQGGNNTWAQAKGWHVCVLRYSRWATKAFNLMRDTSDGKIEWPGSCCYKEECGKG